MWSTNIDEAELHRNGSLNPDLWDGDRLDPEVRTKLLNFAHAWGRFAHVPEDKVLDVLMVGGNASLYWNEESDIDVHLLVHRASLGLGPITDDFLKDRKALWTLRHDVRVRGYQVEPYAQDVSERFPAGQGAYSILHERWLQRPTSSSYDPSTDHGLHRKVASWGRAIDRSLGGTVEDMDSLKDRLSSMRSESIRRHGELGRGNLVFKSLRLSGHLDRINKSITDRETRDLSL